MDTITHTLIGVAAAEVGFRHKLGKKSLLVAAALSALPDSDIVSAYAGQWEMLKWHRAETHSFLIAAIAAPLIGMLAAKFLDKGKHYGLWILLSLLCLSLHILDDLCTSWGTEALTPLFDARYAWDALPIIDVLFSLPLLIAAFSALLLKTARLRLSIATIAVSWCLLYTGLGFYMNHRAQQIAVIPEDFKAKSVRSIPSIGTVFLWNVVAKNDKGDYYTQTVSTWTGKSYFPQFHAFTNHPLIELASKSMQYRLLARTSGNMLLAFTGNTPEGKRTVKVIDMRYANPLKAEKPEPLFSTVFEFSRNDKLTSVTRMRNGPPLRSDTNVLKRYMALTFGCKETKTCQK